MKNPIILSSDDPIDVEKHLDTIRQRAEPPQPKDHVRIAKKIIVAHFCGGLLIMLFMFFPNPFPVRYVSSLFLRLVLVINCILGVYLLWLLYRNKERGMSVLKAIAIVLCNIPLVFLYGLFFIYFLSLLSGTKIVSEAKS